MLDLRRLFYAFVLLCLSNVITAKSPELTDLELKRTDPRIIGQLYDALRVMDEVFTEHNVTYWIQSGTLLGAERNGGIIPWDDDADVQILAGEEAKIDSQEVQLAFQKRGYQIFKDWVGYKINIVKPTSYNEKFWSVFEKKSYVAPFIDVFTSMPSPKRSKIIRMSKRSDELWPEGYWSKKDLFPLKRVQYGPISLMAPNNPVPYLARSYGKDWNEVAYKVKDHSIVDQETLTKIKLKIVTRTPAEYVYSELPHRA